MPKKIAPLTVLDAQIQSRNDKTTLVEVSLVLQIVSGVFVIICNILFIWFGILSGWYDVTPDLKVHTLAAPVSGRPAISFIH